MPLLARFLQVYHNWQTSQRRCQLTRRPGIQFHIQRMAMCLQPSSKVVSICIVSWPGALPYIFILLWCTSKYSCELFQFITDRNTVRKGMTSICQCTVCVPTSTSHSSRCFQLPHRELFNGLNREVSTPEWIHTADGEVSLFCELSIFPSKVCSRASLCCKYNLADFAQGRCPAAWKWGIISPHTAEMELPVPSPFSSNETLQKRHSIIVGYTATKASLSYFSCCPVKELIVKWSDSTVWHTLPQLHQKCSIHIC